MNDEGVTKAYNRRQNLFGFSQREPTAINWRCTVGSRDRFSCTVVGGFNVFRVCCFIDVAYSYCNYRCCNARCGVSRPPPATCTATFRHGRTRPYSCVQAARLVNLHSTTRQRFPIHNHHKSHPDMVEKFPISISIAHETRPRLK